MSDAPSSKGSDLMLRAAQMLDRWRSWSEYRDLSQEQFNQLVWDSDEMEEELRQPRETTAKPPHWHCDTHGDFDAMRAVGCPECTRTMRETLRRVRAMLFPGDAADLIDACLAPKTRGGE